MTTTRGRRTPPGAAIRLAAFLVALVLLLAAGFALGRAAGPVDPAPAAEAEAGPSAGEDGVDQADPRGDGVDEEEHR